MNAYNHPMSEAWESLVEVLIEKTESGALKWYLHSGSEFFCMETQANPPAVWFFSQIVTVQAFAYRLERYQGTTKWGISCALKTRSDEHFYVRLFDTILFSPQRIIPGHDPREVVGLLELKENLQKL